MADLDAQEMLMFAKWHDATDLVHNEAFWHDCLENYIGKSVVIPYDDTPAERLAITARVDCPPGTCGQCCRYYDRIAITPEEYKLISAKVRSRINIDADGSKLFLRPGGGCQFLKENACTIYEFRPAVCRAFPILAPRETMSPDGTIFRQLQMRLQCPPALSVIRAMLSRACSSGKLMMLPDLSIIPTYDNAKATLDQLHKEAMTC
ncbi:MAG: YkgJ family cysteine cluster protein [Dehalococcoidia bacterium]|nr:YkgJ family cysteine cluster protein [Dehalococcoidia bacterium]